MLQTIQKFPGGMMSIFFLLGSIVRTCAPGFLGIGSFTTGLFRDGALAMIGLVLFCAGSQISLKESPSALYKGTLLTAAKVLLGIGAGFLFAVFIGARDTLFSIHPITLITALACGNGGLHIALSERYGDKDDVHSGAVTMLTASPFFILIAIGAGGMAVVRFTDILGSIIPVLIGMLLGNLDSDFRKFLAPGVKLSIPFFAFALGSNISLRDIAVAGPQGALLAVLTVAVTGLVPVVIYAYAVPKRWKHANSIAAAMGNTAGSGAIVPALVAQIDPAFLPYVPLATAQVGASAILTAVLSPLVLRVLYQREMQKRSDRQGVYV